MNFVLFENENRKKFFVWENELENLPEDTIAFTYYEQNNRDEFGMMISHEYRIGIPVRFIIGDIYIELDSTEVDIENKDIYCLYSEDGKVKFNPIDKNTILVNDFSDLEEIFESIIRKEQIRKR